MDFQLFNRESLAKFTASAAFNKLETLPITSHRARSHCLNPRADGQDVLLIVAFQEGRVAGYLGVLPDWVFDKNGERKKCGWLSCFWVDPTQRGAGIGGKLMKIALETYENRLFSADYVPATKKIYERSGGFAAEPFVKTGLKLYLRSDLQNLLPGKFPALKKLKPALKLADRLANALLDLRFGPPLFSKNENLSPEKISFEKVDFVDDESAKFIETFSAGQLFRRGKTELNWMLENPWVLANADPNGEARRYHFSAFDRVCEFHCLRGRDLEGRIVAFLIFFKRSGVVKLPYCFVEKPFVAAVGRHILHQLRTWRASQFLTFHLDLWAFFKENLGFALFKKTVRRHYLATLELRELLDFQMIMDGDGDCGFT